MSQESIKKIDNIEKSVEIELTVASGFYVRSFARDLGDTITCGGICSELRRTSAGNVNVDDALEVESVTTEKVNMTTQLMLWNKQ